MAKQITISDEIYEWLLDLAAKKQLKEKKNISFNDILKEFKNEKK